MKESIKIYRKYKLQNSNREAYYCYYNSYEADFNTFYYAIVKRLLMKIYKSDNLDFFNGVEITVDDLNEIYSLMDQVLNILYRDLDTNKINSTDEHYDEICEILNYYNLPRCYDEITYFRLAELMDIIKDILNIVSKLKENEFYITFETYFPNNQD